MLEINNVSRRYGPLTALHDLSFSLAGGEVLGLLGPNGAGKSTTMSILSGVLRPSTGSVRACGVDMGSAPAAAKRNIGYLPEHPPVYADMTLNEYLGFCARLYGLHGDALRQALRRVRQQCDLDGAGERLVGRMSRGEQQRAGIAQALINEPPILLLDEPTVGLDPIQLRTIRDLVLELGKTSAVVLSTHILSEVTSTCDRVLILESGCVLHAGQVAEITGSDNRLRLRCAEAPDLAKLGELPGVRSIDSGADGALLLSVATAPDPTSAIAALVVEQGWGLLELAPEPTTLEQIFLEVVSGAQHKREAAA